MDNWQEARNRLHEVVLTHAGPVVGAGGLVDVVLIRHVWKGVLIYIDNGGVQWSINREEVDVLKVTSFRGQVFGAVSFWGKSQKVN